jgi:alpha-tubulin suppressor-like RCC1 family protein
MLKEASKLLTVACLMASACMGTSTQSVLPQEPMDAMSAGQSDGQPPRQDLPPAPDRRAADDVSPPGTPDAGADAATPATDDTMPPSSVSNTIDLEMGFVHGCALSAAGEMACWGRNEAGQLGDGTTNTSTKPLKVEGLSPLAAIAAGTRISCAIQKDGKLFCWGTGFGLRPKEISGLQGTPIDVAVGHHVCVLLSDSRVACFGSNDYGPLGDGTTDSRPQPKVVDGVTDVAQVEAGTDHTCVRKKDGTVVCWGRGDLGQLGDGSGTNRTRPGPAVTGLSNIVQLSIDSWQSCAVKADHTAWCWGRNVYGEMTVGQVGSNGYVTPARVNSPLQPKGVTDAVQISVGQHFACARKIDGSLMCWGGNSGGQLGVGSKDSPKITPVPVMNMTDAIELEAGGYETCVQRRNGTVACWGGIGMTRTLPTPFPIFP